MAAKKTTNITVYRKKNHVNIGIIVFGAIFVYLIVLVLLYLTDRHVSAYEVRTDIQQRITQENELRNTRISMEQERLSLKQDRIGIQKEFIIFSSKLLI